MEKKEFTPEQLSFGQSSKMFNKIASITDISPVTNLTMNLSSLSTSVGGTPNRRISWSNPFPGGNKLAIDLNDSSPDPAVSPTFQESYYQKVKPKQRRFRHSKITSDSDDDEKENHTPKKPILSSLPKPDLTQDIPDSGYCSSSQKVFSGSSLNSASKSLIFEDEDSMEQIFQFGNSQEEILAVPTSMSSLLNNPLYNNDKMQNPEPASRRGKLPIRRCLSMEMDCDGESIPSKRLPFIEISCPIPVNDIDIHQETKGHFKRPQAPNDYSSYQSKRRKSSPNIEMTNSIETFRLQRSYSETAATIMHAIIKSDLQPELVGDGSRCYSLPLVSGRHQDLKSISSHTLAGLLQGDYKAVNSYSLVDCRYPYEFEGGHIKGAKNIYTKENVLETFLSETTTLTGTNVIIFHCEFSSERAPTLCRFLRNKDRAMNHGNYPHLNHPEIYILEGGYKTFFENYKEFCEPRGYMPMKHKDHNSDMRHFRAKSKSWGCDSKGRGLLRTNSKN